jgi:formylglycine-generating enzyme required for sulfatase activity
MPDAAAAVLDAVAPEPIVWVEVPGGSFEMGGEGGEADELPAHMVSLTAFELMRTEVTVAQYAGCVVAGDCTEPDIGADCNFGVAGREAHPVNCVDWDQAHDFAAYIGGGAHLPTEAEWEYSARSGGGVHKYPWGTWSATCERAVMSDGGDGCGRSSTLPVCSKSAGNSAQGACDLAGNVWEWVEDWYHDSYAGAPADGSAYVSPAGSRRAFRGGSWGNDAGTLRARNRGLGAPSRRGGDLGFRLAR